MKLKRKIVKIDEEKCTGCGLCVNACVEGAIQMINGKAKLISDSYCDGLGACLSECPYGAISIEEREADSFDEEMGKKRPESMKTKVAHPAHPGCPGMKIMSFDKNRESGATRANPKDIVSKLSQWPIQLHLISPSAPFWNESDIVLAADCTAFTLGSFHQRILAGKKLIIACPKLDDTSPYVDKLTAILKYNDVKSITIVRMEVPCCAGIANFAKAAIENSGKKVPFNTIIIGIDGSIKEKGDKI